MKKSSLVLIVSVCANLALAYLLLSRKPPAKPAPQPAGTHPSRPQSVESPPPQTAQAPVAQKTPALTWAALESADYKVYMKNLRAFGCPEETIRDIIIADVHKLYSRKRAALSKPEPFKFWQAEPRPDDDASRARREKVRALQKEEDAVLAELFGPDWRSAASQSSSDADFDERFFGGLPEEKREKVRAIDERFTEEIAEVYLRSGGDELSSEEKRKLRDLKQQQRQALAAALTPAELEEYEARNSETAQHLRDTLAGQNWSKEDFLSVFRLQQAFDEKFGEGSAASRADRMQAEQELQAKLKAALGEQRYAGFQRGQDPDYQDLFRLAQNFNLPQDAAAKVYDVQRLATEQIAKIEADASLDPAQQAQARAAIEQERDQALQGLLGDKAFKAFQRRLAR
ncbi:MAG: hypothetical protein HY300_11900 [Verrucomicrobia bacterium]|nr:hypothetical protein [Verrucomicrobiota bacterium]